MEPDAPDEKKVPETREGTVPNTAAGTLPNTAAPETAIPRVAQTVEPTDPAQ